MKPHGDRSKLLQILISFRYALVGLRVLARDRNMIVHLVAAITVTVLGFVYQVSALEWLGLVLAMTVVMSLEAMNSALEFAVDLASPAFHPLAAKAKDVASAAVLIAAIGAGVVGAIVFLPKITGT